MKFCPYNSMDRISLCFGLAVGFEFLRTCSSFPVNDYRDAFADSSTWIGVSLVLSLAFVVLGILFLAGCLCCRRETNGFKKFHNSVTNLSQAGVGFTNPSLNQPSQRGGGSELSIFPPPGAVTFEPLPAHIQPHPVAAASVYSKPPAFATAAQATNQELDIGDWFVGNNANFPREQLHYLREYGRGWFGRVVEGEARGVDENGGNCKVVVRILREDATASEQKFFLNEVKTFRDLSHPNVLRLVARCLETDPYLILLESCSSGDLKSFLCGNVASRTALCEQGICLRMMCDVANGLQHILQHGFVHTDLAARNCLVTSDLTVKVGDYGTSIEMYKDDYYIAGDVALPIRWCAPESLHCTDTTIETKQVTACANVWSFGVLLWEVCEFGALPYTSLSDDQVIVRVLGKERLKLAPPTHPSLHTAHLYSLMQMCWNEEPTRPSLDHVIAMLKHLQMSRTSDSDDNFERRWEKLKPNTIPVTDNQTSSDALTIRSDFDSGVDLDLKTNSDHDLKSSALDLKSVEFGGSNSSSHFGTNSSSHFDINSSQSVLEASNSDIRTSSSEFDCKLKGSPQLSVASSLGGDYFAAQLARQLSPSLTNLRGSFEDVVATDDVVTGPSQQKPSFDFNLQPSDTDQFDSWLQGVDTTDEEEVKFVKNISEAIRDLDNRLAMEKTSSSSEASSRHESPVKEASLPQQNPVLDFRLGPITCLDSRQPLLGGQQLDSLQEDSLCVRRDSSSDTEEETWRGRIERGEFTEKVKEKSKSVADLMILTHIENSSDESDSLPSLTRQFSIEKNRRFVTGKNLAVPTMMTSIGFGSEGNIRGAVLGEEFQESLKLLQTAWKIREAESRQASLTVDQVQNEACATVTSSINAPMTSSSTTPVSSSYGFPVTSSSTANITTSSAAPMTSSSATSVSSSSAFPVTSSSSSPMTSSTTANMTTSSAAPMTSSSSAAAMTSSTINSNDGSNFLGDTASEKFLVCASGEGKKSGDSSQVKNELVVSEIGKNEEVESESRKNEVGVESEDRKNEIVLVSSSVENDFKAVGGSDAVSESDVNNEERVERFEEMSDVDEDLKQKSGVVEVGEIGINKTVNPNQVDEKMTMNLENIEKEESVSPIQGDRKVTEGFEGVETPFIAPTSRSQENGEVIKNAEFIERIQTPVINSTSPIPDIKDVLKEVEDHFGKELPINSTFFLENEKLSNKDANITEDVVQTTKEIQETKKTSNLSSLKETDSSKGDENCKESSRVKREAPHFDENFPSEDLVEADKFLASNQIEENGNFDEFFSKIENELNGNTLVKEDELSEKSLVEGFISRERNNVESDLKDDSTHLTIKTKEFTHVEKNEESGIDSRESNVLFEETVRNDFEVMDSLPESERIYENELTDSTNKESPDDVTSDITSFVQSPLDGSTGLLQDNLDSKETSLSELESSSQSSEQTMTVVENDPLRNEEVIPDLNNSNTEVVVVNGGGKLPEIVVTEAVDVDNVPANQDSDNVSANYEYKPRRQIRILIANDSSDDTDSENDCDVFDDSKFPIVVSALNSSSLPSQSTAKQQEVDKVVGEVKIEESNTKEQKGDLDKIIDGVEIKNLNTCFSQPTIKQLKEDVDEIVDEVEIKKLDSSSIETTKQDNNKVVEELEIEKLDQENSFTDDEKVKINNIDLEKSFNTSDAINIFSLDEEVGSIDKLKAINVDLQIANVEDTKQSTSNSNINESYSVILGSCEDYTLDYFKGLKTTSGKPATFDSDYSTNEISKSDSEIEDTDVSSTDREDNINNWDTFLTNSLKDKVTEKEENFNVQFNNGQELDSVGSSDVNSEDTVVDDENEEESERLNKKNLDFSRDNNNFINEKNLNSRLLPRDYENRNSRIIQVFDNSGFQVDQDRLIKVDQDQLIKVDQDRQMNEVKNRLEDVAKLSEGFHLKKEAEEEEDEGKLLTPDDERSSDSGFRDKGSLSESVEDACDEKYNLEDIEAELEEAYTKTSTESKYFSLHDENSSSSGEFSALASFPTPCSSSTKEDKEEVECLRVKENKGGWFLHPHRASSSAEDEDDSMSGWYPSPVTPELVKDDESPRSFRLDEELNAIRNELQEKLPCAQQIPRDQEEDNSPEEEQQRADMVIEYGSYPVPLSPIMEEGESVSSNQSSIILDLHSSNVSSGKSSPVMMMLDRNDSFDDEEAGRRFEEDIRTALDLYSSDSIESDEVVDIIVEDLEGREGETRKMRGENKEEEEEDLLIVNTETNEAQLLESPRPKSHLAFVRKSKIEKNLSPMNGTNTYTPDSISPISTGSSRTGVALSFSSPDTGGNLSIFLSPSNSENVDSEYSVNNSLDLDVVAKDLKSVPNFFDHKQMFDKLKELEEESSSDTSEMSSERTISVPGKSVLEDGRKEFEEEKTDREVGENIVVKLDSSENNSNSSATNHEETIPTENRIESDLMIGEKLGKSESNQEETSPTKNFIKEVTMNGENIEKDVLIKGENGTDSLKTSPTAILDIKDERFGEKELINDKSGANIVKISPSKDFNKEDFINDVNVGKKEPVSNEKDTNDFKIRPTDNLNKEELLDDQSFDERQLRNINKVLMSDGKELSMIDDKIDVKVDTEELSIKDDEIDNKIQHVSTDLVLEKLLETKVASVTHEKVTHEEATTEESKDWLKSVLLPLTTKPSEKVQSAAVAGTVLPKSSWPSSDELIPEKLNEVLEKKIEKLNEIVEKKIEKFPSDFVESDKKKIELNSTLALLSPNLSVGTDSSMVSSFSSTPTFDTTKSIGEMSLSISSTDGEDSQRILVPSLRALASDVLRLHKKVLKPISDETSSLALSKKSLTLALDSSAVISKVPMPSPEDADKGSWKPAVNSQLMDLTSQSEHDLESDDLMTTSFIDGDGDQYNPDWESDTSDGDSEDHSSSSGEFIWKDGDREESVKAKVATFSTQSQDDIAEQQHVMARIDEEDEEEEEEAADDSSCGSATEFVPSVWDKAATPTKSALRLADKKQDSLKRVCFKEQEYHCVYEYPGEPSDSDDDDDDDNAMDSRKRNWETPSSVDYSCFADWELAEGESVSERDITDLSADDYTHRNSSSSNKHKKNDFDFYQLGAVDYDFTQMTTDDGEFFISSSARPFQGFSDVSSSEFFPGSRLSFDLDADTSNQISADNKADITGATDKACKEFINNEKGLSNAYTTGEPVGVGGLRHTREWLKLDLPATFTSKSTDRPASFSSHSSAVHEAKLSKSQSSDFPTTSKTADELIDSKLSETPTKSPTKLDSKLSDVTINSSSHDPNDIKVSEIQELPKFESSLGTTVKEGSEIDVA